MSEFDWQMGKTSYTHLLIVCWRLFLQENRAKEGYWTFYYGYDLQM